MSSGKIFFDLDGTLINSKMRLYRLFCDITSQNIFNFDEYWELKQAKNGHRFLTIKYLGYTETDFIEFERKWFSLIETEKYLNYDEPFDFTKNVLAKLKSQKFELYILTSRQFKEITLKQLFNLGLFPFFEKILITCGSKSKFDLVKESGILLSYNDILVGDTGVDIDTAKALNIRSVAVLSGFRNREVLEEYSPDFIENDIRFITSYVNGK